MIHVQHLLSGDAEFAAHRTSDLVCREAGNDFRIAAQSVGGRGQLRCAAAAWNSLRNTKADVVHAWGMAALAVASLSGARRIIFSPGAEAGVKAVGWLRAILQYRNVQTVCASAIQHRLAVRSGVPIERCHLIRPGVEFGRVRKKKDTALRAELGLGEDDFVMLAPGESTRAADHERAVWTCGILNVLDPRVKLLIWGRGERTEAAALLGKRLHQPDMVKLAEKRLGRRAEFEELLGASDACLVTAGGAVSTLPIAICMAGGLPIVSTTNRATAELLEDRHTALMSSGDSPRMLAQRVIDLREDSSLAWAIGDMARTEAFEFFSASRLLNQYRELYRQMAEDRAVMVAEPAAGAGLRFHGRG